MSTAAASNPNTEPCPAPAATPSRAQKAEWAESALNAFIDASLDELQNVYHRRALVDLLASLELWSKENGVDFDQAIRQASTAK